MPDRSFTASMLTPPVRSELTSIAGPPSLPKLRLTCGKMLLDDNVVTSGRVKKKTKCLPTARRSSSGSLEANMEWRQDKSLGEDLDQEDEVNDKGGDDLTTMKYDNRSRAAVRLEKRRNLIKEKIDYIRECLAPDDTPQTLSQASTLQLAAKFIVDNEHVLEEFKQSIADEMPETAMGDLLMMLDKEGKIVLTLQNAMDYLEEDSDALKDRPFLDLVHTPDRERVSPALAELGGQIKRFPCKLVAKGGDIYQYDVRIQLVSYNDTDHIMLSAMRAFKCQRLEEGKVLGDGHESSYTAWVICEPDGTITHAGSSAGDSLVFGYPSASLVGQSYYKGIHPDDIATVAKMHLLIVRAAQSSYLYYRAQTRGGFWALVDALAVPCVNRTTSLVDCYVVEMRCTETNTHIPKPGALHRNGAQSFLPITYDGMDSLLEKCEQLVPKRDEKDGVSAESTEQAPSGSGRKASGVVADRKDSFKLTSVFGLTRVTTERTRGGRAGGRRPAGLTSLIVPPAPALPPHPTAGVGGDSTPVAGNTPRRSTLGSVSDLQLQQMQALQATADTLTQGPSSLGTGVQVGLPTGPLSARQYPPFVTPRPQPLHHAPYRLDRGNAGPGMHPQHTTPTAATSAAATLMMQLQQQQLQQQQQMLQQQLTSPFGIPEMLAQMALMSPHYHAMLANLTPRGGVNVAGVGATAFNVEQQLALQQGLGGLGMDQTPTTLGMGMGHVNVNLTPHMGAQMGMGGVGVSMGTGLVTPTPSPRNNVAVDAMGNVVGMMPNVQSQALQMMSSAPLLGAANPHVNTGTLRVSPRNTMMGQNTGAMGLQPMGGAMQNVSSFHSLVDTNVTANVGHMGGQTTPRGYMEHAAGVGVNHIQDQPNMGLNFNPTRPLPNPAMHSAPAGLSLPNSHSTMNTGSFGDLSAGVSVHLDDLHVPPLELGDLGDHHHFDLHDYVLGHGDENTTTNLDINVDALGSTDASVDVTGLEILEHHESSDDHKKSDMG